MCLAIPVQVTQILDDKMAIISLSGVEKKISLVLLNESIAVGDYVIVHVGYALSKLDEKDAQKTLAYFTRLG